MHKQERWRNKYFGLVIIILLLLLIIPSALFGEDKEIKATKEVNADVTMTYLDESEQTRKKAPGDLLGVKAEFNITLSDYDIEHMVLGQKVSDNIEIGVNMVGTNAK